MNYRFRFILFWAVLFTLWCSTYAKESIWVLDITNSGLSDSRLVTEGKYGSKITTASNRNFLTTQELQDLYSTGQALNNQYFSDMSERSNLLTTYAIELESYSNDNLYQDDLLEQSDDTENYEYEVSLNSEDIDSLCPVILKKLQDSLKELEPIESQFYDESLYGDLIRLNLESSTYNLRSNLESKEDFITLENNRYYVGGGIEKPQDKAVENVKYSQLFADEETFKNLLRTVNGPQSLRLQTADNMRFEIFEVSGKKYVRNTLNGNAIESTGSKNGIVELDTFLKTIDPKMFVGIVGDDYTRRVNATIVRGNATGAYPVARPVRTVATEVEKIVAPTSVIRTTPQVKCRLKEEVVVPVIERREETFEHKVALARPELVEVVAIPAPPRVVHETQVVERTVPVEVRVPVIEEKIVVRELEKVVTEPPTTIHHIAIPVTDNPAALPPVQFHEEIEEGWPWWLWLLPLLCWIPLLAWLICRRSKPEPVARPKQPMAPVGAKQLSIPKEEEKKSSGPKYIIERKVREDEEEEIDKEITRALQQSKVLKETNAARPPSQERQVVAESGIDSALSRGSKGGRKRRIKTIKKFGQVVGREEQILDEDGNIISTRKMGIDEDEYVSEQQMKGGTGSEHYQESYVREAIGPSSSSIVQERRTRRNINAGRQEDDNSYEYKQFTNEEDRYLADD